MAGERPAVETAGPSHESPREETVSIVPFPRRGLTVRETFAWRHRDPAQWGIFAAAVDAAVLAGVCAGSFWTAVWAYSIGGAVGIVVRALIGV